VRAAPIAPGSSSPLIPAFMERHGRAANREVLALPAAERGRGNGRTRLLSQRALPSVAARAAARRGEAADARAVRGPEG
jgi:hypothetical protein